MNFMLAVNNICSKFKLVAPSGSRMVAANAA